MKKTNDAILISHQDDQSDDESIVSNLNHNVSTDVEKALTQPAATSPIKTNSKGAIQLTPSSTSHATTNAILNLKANPFFHDKRKWDDSFTIDEKKELTGNIVKAAKDNDGETYVTLQKEEFSMPNDHYTEEDSQAEDSDDIDSANKKPGRKPMPDEEDLSDPDQDPKVKRKAQNRAAQRAFRERKERYVKELEIKIKQVQDAHMAATAQLVRENQQLRAIIYRLESENYALKGIPMQPYQTQTPPPVSPAPQRSNATANYPNIAPLPPAQHLLQLPTYLSNSPSSLSSFSSTTSSSVNQMMMLAASPLQQYPMSPVVSAALQNTRSSSPPSKSISKKVSIKSQKSTPPPNNQPLEYTFSISTPASLRPNGGSTSTSKQNKSEPIELVQLYPPGANPRTITTHHKKRSPSPAKHVTESPSMLQKGDFSPVQKATSSVGSPGSCTYPTAMNVNTPSSYVGSVHDDTNSIMSDKTCSTTTTQQQKKIRQLELDMFDCHIDPEGQLFCEKLHSEVCNDAFDRLLSEPLFDQMGKLNLSIGNYPVPIVTGPVPYNEQGEQSSSYNKEEESSSLAIADRDDKEDKSNDKHNATTATVNTNAAATTTATNTTAATQSTEVRENDSRKNTRQSSEQENPPPSSPTQQKETQLLTCPEIWFLLNQHPKFSDFTTDQLCQAVKELAKCADSGPVLEKSDLDQITSKMDQGYL